MKYRLLLVVSFCLLASCSKQAPPSNLDGFILATIDQHHITEDALRDRMAQRNIASTESGIRDLLDRMVNEEVFAAVARESGLLEDPDVQAAIKRILINRFLEKTLQPQFDAAVPTDDEVKAFYHSHQQDYMVPAQRRVAMLFKSTNNQLEAMTRWREEIVETPEKMADLIRMHSDDEASRYRGGDIGWFTDGEARGRHGEIAAEVFSLTTEAPVSEILTTSRGHYLVRLLESRPAKPQPFEEVRHVIKRRLHSQKESAIRQAFYQNSRSQIECTVDEKAVESLVNRWATPSSEVGTLPLARLH